MLLLAESGFSGSAAVSSCSKEHSEAVFLLIVAERLRESGRIAYTAWWGWEAKGGVDEARFL
jgi:hypothetical protein